MADRISVVIPAYKAADYIEQTVRSALAQTWDHIEVLVIDDGSPDDTAAVVEGIDDPRVRLIRQPNRGVAEARNRGIRESTGDFVALLDADDLWLPNKLARHMAHFAANPKLGTSFSRSLFIDGDGQPMGLYQNSKVEGITPADMFIRCPIGNGSVPVMRREALDAIGFESSHFGEPVTSYFDASPELLLGEDVECWYRLLTASGWEMAGVPEHLTLYRIYKTSSSANLSGKAESWERLLDWVARYDAERVAGFKAAAMAYHDRYLARRAVTNGHGVAATRYATRAITSYPAIVAEEPARTAITLAASLATCVLPTAAVDSLRHWLSSGNRKRQQQAIDEAMASARTQIQHKDSA